MKLDKLKSKLDKLSRNNRIFTDNLIRLMACEITSSRFDNTWYFVHLPSYAGGYGKGVEKGVIQISGKAFADVKCANDFFTEKELELLTDWIRVKRDKHQVRIREEFGELFNDSTTSALN